jgi:uncharacterized protein YjbJ (UPF0337 family)
MSSEDEVPEAPATWENVVVGEAKEVLGHVVRNDDLVEEGHEQVDAAHEAREKYKEEHDRES